MLHTVINIKQYHGKHGAKMCNFYIDCEYYWNCLQIIGYTGHTNTRCLESAIDENRCDSGTLSMLPMRLEQLLLSTDSQLSASGKPSFLSVTRIGIIDFQHVM